MVDVISFMWVSWWDKGIELNWNLGIVNLVWEGFEKRCFFLEWVEELGDYKRIDFL